MYIYIYIYIYIYVYIYMFYICKVVRRRAKVYCGVSCLTAVCLCLFFFRLRPEAMRRTKCVQINK